MNAIEVVFELVLLPNTRGFERLLKPEESANFDLSLAKAKAKFELESNMVLTKVRIRTAEHLLWVVRAADIRLWGLIGKQRFWLYDRSNDRYLPLFMKEDVPNGTRSWRINRELVKHFTTEVPNESRVRRGYRQRLKKPLKEVCEEIQISPLPESQNAIEDSWFNRDYPHCSDPICAENSDVHWEKRWGQLQLNWV